MASACRAILITLILVCQLLGLLWQMMSWLSECWARTPWALLLGGSIVMVSLCPIGFKRQVTMP